MVAKPENLKHFVFNSDYPTDKIIWMYEGSQESWDDDSIGKWQEIPVNKILGTKVTIFVKGSYSVDDWQSSWMIGSKDDGANGFVHMSWGLVGPDYSTSYGVSLDFDGNFPRFYPGKTIKYRLWGVCREDTRDAAEYAKNASKTKSKLIFNTDLNYPRLYKDGVAKSGETITHNLGRIPYVDYWFNYDNTFKWSWRYQPYSYFTNSSPYEAGVKATDKTITFSKVTYNNEDDILGDYDAYYYYRIYI